MIVWSLIIGPIILQSLRSHLMLGYTCGSTLLTDHLLHTSHLHLRLSVLLLTWIGNWSAVVLFVLPSCRCRWSSTLLDSYCSHRNPRSSSVPLIWITLCCHILFFLNHTHRPDYSQHSCSFNYSACAFNAIFCNCEILSGHSPLDCSFPHSPVHNHIEQFRQVQWCMTINC